MKISLIGSGNVATHIAGALYRAGWQMLDVYSPTTGHAKGLADAIGAQACTDITRLRSADCFIIAVKDDAIAEVLQGLNPHNAILVHTSGTTPLAALTPFSANTGVFYPLQSFTKNRAIDFSNVPLCIEASNNETLQALNQLANSISRSVHSINSRQRLKLHIAAVIAANFTNHLYQLAAGFMEKEGLSFDLLKPLILEIALKVQGMQPADAQTGPAIRNDRSVIEKHFQQLEHEPELLNLYKILSASIRQTAKPR